jgi:hypothetical protein
MAVHSGTLGLAPICAQDSDLGNNLKGQGGMEPPDENGWLVFGKIVAYLEFISTFEVNI